MTWYNKTEVERLFSVVSGCPVVIVLTFRFCLLYNDWLKTIRRFSKYGISSVMDCSKLIINLVVSVLAARKSGTCLVI